MTPAGLQWGHGLSAVETRPCVGWAASHSRALQWGHGLSAVETGAVPQAGSDGGSGFNGATAFQPWKHTSPNPAKSYHERASMGPRPFSRGNEANGSVPSRGRPTASMGPRPFSRGNLPLLGDTLAIHLGFNGATAFQPWKLLFTRCRMTIANAASMGPRPFSRGNARDHPRCDSPRSCFNGATAFQPWKQPAWRAGTRAAGAASMGPRPFSRGNSINRSARSPTPWRFNGATAFQPWKQGARRRVGSDKLRLQWGHGLSAVETGLCIVL